jgi:hypothetical protein
MTAREWKGSKGVRPALAPPVGDDAGIFRPIPLLATRLLTKPFSYDNSKYAMQITMCMHLL